MIQFKRVYSLSLVGPIDTKVIEDLRIAFEIKKSMRSYPNLAKIDIYNLAPETINFIQTKNPLILLRAGYSRNPRLIFRGRVRNLFVNKRGVDRITTLYSGDGDQEWQRASFNKTLGPNIGLKETVLDIFKSFTEGDSDVSIGAVEGISEVASNLLGQSLSGSSKDVLDDLADAHGFQWSIQDGELTAISGSSPLTSRTAVLINQGTGMLGSPTITEIGAEVTTLLNPELLPNRAFKIEADSADIAVSNLQFRNLKRTQATGLYRAYEVIFQGDNRGAAWVTKAKGTFVNV